MRFPMEYCVKVVHVNENLFKTMKGRPHMNEPSLDFYRVRFDLIIDLVN